MDSSRFLIEIQSWDWSLHVGLCPTAMPAEQRFQGGLLYTRGLDIEGQVVAPKACRAKSIRIWLSPQGPDIVFGPDGLQDVGRFYCESGRPGKADFEASLFLPESALESTMICLSSIWRYIHIWIDQDNIDPLPVTDFSFSRDVHKNLLAWANES
jgi:hypothetical protein